MMNKKEIFSGIIFSLVNPTFAVASLRPAVNY